MSIQLSVIVLAYNQSALTRACLAALDPGWPSDWELLLVDNASTDDTAELGRGTSGPAGLRLVRMATNQSFAVANNHAAREARGRFLLFLNNDVEIEVDAVSRLLDASARAGAPSIAGAKLLYPGRRRVQHAGIRPMLWGLVSNFGVGAPPEDPSANAAGPIFAVTGACFLVERALFASLNGFDEGFHFGYEDADLCLRARSAGRLVCYVPEAIGLHKESVTLGSAHYDRTREANYARFRSRWSDGLDRLERAYVERLRANGIQRVVVFGTGAAGRAVAGTLRRSGVEVVAMTASKAEPGSIEDIPVVRLEELDRGAFDRLIVGTQFYFDVAEMLRPFDPAGAPIFPVLDGTVPQTLRT